MSKDDSLDAIINKYNRLCARYKDLEQQSKEKQETWKQIEKSYKKIEDMSRNLCETILAKDRNEMVLGTEYAWGQLPTETILTKAKSSYINYNEERTQLLKDIHRQSETRRIESENKDLQIESLTNEKKELKDLIKQMQKNREIDYSESNAQDEYNAELEEELETAPFDEPNEPDNEPNDNENKPENRPKTNNETTDPLGQKNKKVSEKTLGRMPLDMQNAAKTGTVNIMPDNDAMDFGNAVNPETDTPPPVGIPKSEQKATDKTKYIEEEKDAITSLIQNEVAEESEEINYAKTGANITSAQRKVQAVKETRIKNAKMMQIDITETEKTLKYQHWTILKVIGETGACEISEIISLCSDSSKKDNNNLSESTIKHTCTALINKQCIGRDEIKHPIKSNFFVYSLTEIGKQLYTDKFGKKPVISEKNILIAQHDNLEHAFGIKELKRIIESTNKFSDISMDRKTNTIKLKDGNIYIPDIIAQPKGKPYKMYFEYERGTHHQSDFDAKMNKAAKNNPYVNIVVPNSDTARDLVNKVNSWIESRGGYNSLKNNGIKIRITPLRYLEGKDNINNDGYWQFVYNLRNSIEPMENQFRGKEE